MNTEQVKQTFRLGPGRHVEQVMASLMQVIAQLPHDADYQLTLAPYRANRSLEQNAQGHVWYGVIGKETGQTPAEVKRYCKLHFGVPILRSENEDFRELYDKAFRRILNYEEKLKAMDFLPVTSIMTVAQESRYLETVQAHYAENGIQLYWGDEIRVAENAR